MKTICRFTTAASLCLLLLAVAGCGQGNSDVTEQPTAASTTPVDFKAQFEQAQRLAEEERQKQLDLIERRRGPIVVAFHGFDEQGRVVVSLTNRTGKPIDDIRGGIMAEDAEGNTIASSGLTIAVPGDVFLDVGASLNHAPFMNERPELVERLKTQPESVHFAFEAQEVIYTDGTKEPDLDS